MKLLDIREVSRILGMKPKTLYSWRSKNRHLPFIKIGGSLRISEEDLFQFVLKNKSKKAKN